MKFSTLCLGPDTPSDYTGTIQLGKSDITLLSWVQKVYIQVMGAAVEAGFSKEYVQIEFLNVEGEKRKRGPATNRLDPFENVVVDPNLQLKLEKETEDLPTHITNSFFLLGGLRLETTSPLVGIGYSILANNPDLKLTFLSSEQFSNDIITAVGGNLRAGFRKRYRNLDLLIIDEIQSLFGKELEIEVFFQTLMTLRTESNRW